jgi:hypothetical protein
MPANPKKPQDHKKPQPGAPTFDESTRVLTVVYRGVRWGIAVDAIDDFETILDLAEMDKTSNPVLLARALKKLIGDQMGQAMDTCRGKDGRVSIAAAADFFKGLMGSLDPNSSGSPN